VRFFMSGTNDGTFKYPCREAPPDTGTASLNEGGASDWVHRCPSLTLTFSFVSPPSRE
jgi:hypothetical protein